MHALHWSSLQSCVSYRLKPSFALTVPYHVARNNSCFYPCDVSGGGQKYIRYTMPQTRLDAL